MNNDKKLTKPFGFNIENFLHSENQRFSDYSFSVNWRDKNE